MSSNTLLLQAISGAHPCGEDLSFSSELDVIAQARLYDDPTLDQGDWVVALKEADWPFVAARCAELIQLRSKDLQLAVWLAEAQARTQRFRGLGDAYALLAGLCRAYWDGLYPLAEDGDVERRVGNLYWLLARTPQWIREMPLGESISNAFSIADFDAARQRASRIDPAAAQDWGAPKEDPGPSVAQLEAARQKNTAAFTATLLADAQYCQDALLDLENAVDARLGATGPSFSAAREALANAIHFLAPRGAAAVHGAGETSAAGVAAGGMPAGGAIMQRAQALAQLRLVADFFRRSEPHSPVAYLADKAATWGEMPLHLWLRAVVKDSGAIAQLDDLLGVVEPK